MKININKTLFVLAAATSVSLSAFALSAADLVSTKTESSTERDYKGNYVVKTTVEGEDSEGTRTSDTSETKVKLDADGNYKKTINTEVTKDPEGFFNKSVLKSSKTIKGDDDNYEDSSSVETRSDDTGTKTTKESSVESRTNSEGDVERLSKTKVSTDPKGLMNRSTVKTSDKMEKKDGKTIVAKPER